MLNKKSKRRHQQKNPSSSVGFDLTQLSFKNKLFISIKDLQWS